MPEMRFVVRWPDDTLTSCYSPSSTIRDALELQRPYGVDEFVRVSSAALEHASRRVAAKYGFGCGQALAQINEIKRRAQGFAGLGDARVMVESFES
jgi:uncharacterized repeat protein (TIGR04042 family)